MAKGMKMREYNISFFKAYIAVTTDAGANITATADGKSYTATADTSGNATIEVKKAGRYTVVASKNGKTVQGTVDVLQDKVTYNINLPFISKILNDNSWDIISKVSAEGQGANWWNVGDCKQIHFQGTVGTKSFNFDPWVFILGFNHNWQLEGKGISFGTFKTDQYNGEDIAITDSKYNGDFQKNGEKYFNMEHLDRGSREANWQKCDLRFDILGACKSKGQQNAPADTATNPVQKTVMSALPYELRKVIKRMIKYTFDHNGISSTKEYLTLLAEFEVLGESKQSSELEQNSQKQYDYYMKGNSKRKGVDVDTSEDAAWWLRSPYRFGGAYNVFMRWNGDAARIGVYYSLALSPVFLV